MRIIPTRIHGVLDYLSVAALLAIPRVLGWDSLVTNLLTGSAAGTLAYSMLTRYELGLAEVLPMKGHLALDGIGGAALCGAALMFRDREEASVVGALYGLGVFELAAAVMTQTEPSSSSIRHGIGR